MKMIMQTDLGDRRNMLVLLEREDGTWQQIVGTGTAYEVFDRQSVYTDTADAVRSNGYYLDFWGDVTHKFLKRSDLPAADDDKAWEKFVLEGVQ